LHGTFIYVAKPQNAVNLYAVAQRHRQFLIFRIVKNSKEQRGSFFQ